MRKLFRPLYRALFSESSRARLRPLAYPLDSLFRALVWRSTRGRVGAGPFTGLSLASDAPLPHLLGTYERELHDVIESLCGRPWQRIVNVGGGNGFYVAGLGRRIAGAELVVFEFDTEAQVVIADTVARNGLAARSRILGVADPAGLEAACAGASQALVVMDVEGAELELADPVLVPSLRRATIVVETHDVLRPGCRDTVAARFAGTHTLIAIATRARTPEDFPGSLSPMLRRFAPARCLGAVQEWRGGAQEWLILEPHG